MVLATNANPLIRGNLSIHIAVEFDTLGNLINQGFETLFETKSEFEKDLSEFLRKRKINEEKVKHVTLVCQLLKQ